MSGSTKADYDFVFTPVYSKERHRDIADSVADWLDNFKEPRQYAVQRALGIPFDSVMEWSDDKSIRKPVPYFMFMLYRREKDENFLLTAEERRKFNEKALADSRFAVPEEMPFAQEDKQYQNDDTKIVDDRYELHPPARRLQIADAFCSWYVGLPTPRSKQLERLLNGTGTNYNAWLAEKNSPKPITMHLLYTHTGNTVFLLTRKEKQTYQKYFSYYDVPAESVFPDMPEDEYPSPLSEAEMTDEARVARHEKRKTAIRATSIRTVYTPERIKEISAAINRWFDLLETPKLKSAMDILTVGRGGLANWRAGKTAPHAKYMYAFYCLTREEVFCLLPDERAFFALRGGDYPDQWPDLNNPPSLLLKNGVPVEEVKDEATESETFGATAPQVFFSRDRLLSLSTAIDKAYHALPTPKRQHVRAFFNVDSRAVWSWRMMATNMKAQKSLLPRNLLTLFRKTGDEVFLLLASEESAMANAGIEFPEAYVALLRMSKHERAAHYQRSLNPPLSVQEIPVVVQSTTSSDVSETDDEVDADTDAHACHWPRERLQLDNFSAREVFSVDRWNLIQEGFCEWFNGLDSPLLPTAADLLHVGRRTVANWRKSNSWFGPTIMKELYRLSDGNEVFLLSEDEAQQFQAFGILIDDDYVVHDVPDVKQVEQVVEEPVVARDVSSADFSRMVNMTLIGMLSLEWSLEEAVRNAPTIGGNVKSKAIELVSRLITCFDLSLEDLQPVMPEIIEDPTMLQKILSGRAKKS